MKGLYSSKLDHLTATVQLACRADCRDLSRALAKHCEYPVLAIASGGSVVSAEFLAAGRVSLNCAPTLVITPMSYVLGAVVRDVPAWLFSASGQNNDILAALEVTRSIPAPRVNIVTSGPDGSLAQLGRDFGAHVHLVPVVDPRDGFLSTHSIVSAAVSLAIAVADATSSSVSKRVDRMLNDAEHILSEQSRNAVQSEVASLARRSTLFLLHDPRLSAAAVLVETSCWEAGLCAVQRTDFRNFTHGRHVWMAQNADQTFILALTSEGSHQAWTSIASALPSNVSTAHFDFGRSDCEDLFEAILLMMVFVEAAGVLKDIDPGRPGVPEFGRRIFDTPDLVAEARRVGATVSGNPLLTPRLGPTDQGVGDRATRRNRT
jgi:D-arabinose 5-phosphate isomerase GutQ